MNAPSLGLSAGIAVGFANSVARILVSGLVLSLVAVLALTSALALWSMLDVAFYVVGSMHESAIVVVAGLG